MATLFFALRSIVNVILGICLLCLICLIASIVHDRSIKSGINEFSDFVNNKLGKVKKAAIAVICICVVISLIDNPGIQQVIGLENLLLKPEGDYCFYIEVDNKYYPALIHVSSDEEEYGYYGENKKTKHYYFLKEAVLWDEKVHEFSAEDNVLNIGESEYVISDDELEFDCTLVNEHAYSPLLKEDNDANVLNFIILGIKELSYILVIIALMKGKEEKQDEDNSEQNY